MENNPAPINTSEGNMAPSPQKSGKGAVVALVLVLVLAIGAVGGTWYYMNNKAKNDKKAQQEQIQQLQKQVGDLQAIETTSNQTAITSQVKAMYEYWINGKEKDYNYLLKNNYITQAVFDQSRASTAQADLVSCSQNTLPKASDYQYGVPSVTTPNTANMKITGVYPTSTVEIVLDLTKTDNIWKVNKINCPKQ
jgi:hypothetical protein